MNFVKPLTVTFAFCCTNAHACDELVLSYMPISKHLSHRGAPEGGYNEKHRGIKHTCNFVFNASSRVFRPEANRNAYMLSENNNDLSALSLQESARPINDDFVNRFSVAVGVEAANFENSFGENSNGIGLAAELRGRINDQVSLYGGVSIGMVSGYEDYMGDSSSLVENGRIPYGMVNMGGIYDINDTLSARFGISVIPPISYTSKEKKWVSGDGWMWSREEFSVPNKTDTVVFASVGLTYQF